MLLRMDRMKVMIFGIRTDAAAFCVTGIFLIASRGWAAQVFALDSAKGLQPHHFVSRV